LLRGFALGVNFSIEFSLMETLYCLTWEEFQLAGDFLCHVVPEFCWYSPRPNSKKEYTYLRLRRTRNILDLIDPLNEKLFELDTNGMEGMLEWNVIWSSSYQVPTLYLIVQKLGFQIEVLSELKFQMGQLSIT
jgi:hypothetical protein